MWEALKTGFGTEDSKAARSTVRQQSGISARCIPEGEGEDWTGVVAVAAVVDAERDAQARRPGGCNVRQPGDRKKRCSSEVVRQLQCETVRRSQKKMLKRDSQAAAMQGSQATKIAGKDRRLGSCAWRTARRRQGQESETVPLRQCQLGSQAQARHCSAERIRTAPAERAVSLETTGLSLMHLPRSCWIPGWVENPFRCRAEEDPAVFKLCPHCCCTRMMRPPGVSFMVGDALTRRVGEIHFGLLGTK